METSSISQSEKSINEQECTAFIYSISDLFAYIVEIRHHHQSYIIGNRSEPDKFHNLSDAKNAAKSHHALKCFLALDKTYQEVASDLHFCSHKEEGRYDYVALDL